MPSLQIRYLLRLRKTLERRAAEDRHSRNGQFCSIGTYTQSDYCVTAQ